MATKTGVPRTRAVRTSTAIGQPAVAIRSGTRPRAKAAGTAARATTRPSQPFEAPQAKRQAMRPSAAGITSSRTHTGVPPMSFRPSSRFARTRPTAA